MIEITVDCRKSSPGIVNDCVIIGDGFFQLDKISFVQEIQEGYYTHHGTKYRTRFFNLVCDGIQFNVMHHAFDYTEYEDIEEHWIEKFNKFGLELIDIVFDEDTRNNTKKKKYI